MSEDAAEVVAGFEIPSWFWWVGVGLCAGVVALTILWYARHPDRSLFEDFQARGQMGAPETNGAVPHPAPQAGADVMGG